MPAFNLQPFLQGVKQYEQQQKEQQTQQLVGAFAGMDPQQVLNSPEFVQLQAINPQVANQVIGGQASKLQLLQSQMGLDDARTANMFKDALTARGLLDVSQDKALNFLSNRANMIAQTGGNPEDTLEVRELIARGDMKGAKSLLDSVVKAGQQSGILAKPETVAKQAVGQTGLVFDPMTSTFTLDEIAAARIDELNNKKNEKGGLSAKDRQSIGKDITGFIEQADSIKTAADDLQVLKKIGSGPAAIAAVFKFMKVLDPGSVVKEDEFATAQNSAGVPQGVRNMFNKLLSGEILGQNQFDQFISTAQGLANNAISSTQNTVDDYLDTFEDTIPESFKALSRERLPKLFEMNDTSNDEFAGFKVVR